MQSGQSLWHELVHKYDTGVQQVQQMQDLWAGIEGSIDQARFSHVSALLKVQQYDATYWRDACVSYFSSVNGLPLPEGSSKPAHSLEYYKKDEHQRYIPDPWYPVKSGH